MELVGYVDYGAGMILCRPCGSAAGGVDDGVQPLYDVELGGGDSPDTCAACGVPLDPSSDYGVRSCAAEGCGAILSYPDEGAACPEHTCAACGVVVHPLAVFSLAWRDDSGAVYLDGDATACLGCFSAIMDTLSPDRALRVGYKRRPKVTAAV